MQGKLPAIKAGLADLRKASRRICVTDDDGLRRGRGVHLRPYAKDEFAMTAYAVPEGFVSLPRSSPLLDLLGPAYRRGEGLDLEIGLRSDNRHANGRGTVHGGVLATLADVGMGYAMAFSSEPPLPLITASMTLDYLGPVQVGDWIVVRLEHHKRGRQMAFATVSLQVGENVVARATAVFAVPRTD
jgi:acyl-coenzyme A thioesterase 13